jgi:hypothetical protein
MKKAISSEYNLKMLFPEIAKEWHPDLNGDLTPEQVTPGSNKKIWWVCNHTHPYEASVYSRSHCKSGCPYCAGQKATSITSLAFKFPEIAAEWHPTKNFPLTPTDILPGCDKKVWWRCERGHEWEARVFSRTNAQKTGCPNSICRKERKRTMGIQKITGILPGAQKFIEIEKHSRVLNQRGNKDIIRVAFYYKKYGRLILKIGKNIAAKVGITHKDKISFSYQEDNHKIWLIKKSPLNSGFKPFVGNPEKCSFYTFQIAWHLFIPNEKEIKTKEVEYKIVGNEIYIFADRN